MQKVWLSSEIEQQRHYRAPDATTNTGVNHGHLVVKNIAWRIENGVQRGVANRK